MDEVKPIYTGDIETDPFAHRRIPVPFVTGFYDGKNFLHFWGKHCIKQFVDYIETLPAGIIYFHNGGRFDLFYFLKYLHGDMMIINSRIVKANLGKHEVRDSYAIMPFALAQYKKDDIDYRLLEKDKRQKHKGEILKYLEGDCLYLWELCKAFVDMFGNKLTIGSTSMGELQKIHSFEKLTSYYDNEIRSRFFFGGRVQCFKKGVITQPIKIYDVNSMYPSVMRNFQHPIGAPTSTSRRVSKETCFIIVEGHNRGAFPMRNKQGINFDTEFGTFHVSKHEWEVAMQYDLFSPTRIINCVNFQQRGCFAEFVDHFYNARKKAIEDKDEIKKMFYKYVLNSAYGKFAQNPINYFDYRMTQGTTECDGWTPSFINNAYTIWKKPTSRSTHARHNVATACSITGAARSILLQAIATSKGLLYCDTDSLICEEIGKGVEIDKSKLGAWKLEDTGTKAAIAGKKMYAIFNGKECVKLACKGAKLSPSEIVRVAKGKKITYENQAPTFKWDGSTNFITREIRLT